MATVRKIGTRVVVEPGYFTVLAHESTGRTGPGEPIARCCWWYIREGSAARYHSGGVMRPFKMRMTVLAVAVP